MSKLYYKIGLREIYDNGKKIDEYDGFLPHIEQIKEWIGSVWAACQVEKAFSMPEIRNNVAHCDLAVKESKDGTTYAMITIEFVPGFRLSARKRESVWDDLDAQMSDGFGECIDHQPIPNAPDGYFLEI